MAAERLLIGTSHGVVIVRTRDNVQPLFVSVGHKIDQASAVRVVLESAQGYRIPEPTRRAHHLVNELRRASG